ncbi:MAG: nucleotidyltransferase family protein [Lachnospiraceae bacterium]|nr:nucleotidyltransferase family protein [Lachnospiraceae bacterium]
MTKDCLEVYVGLETITITEALKKIDENALGVLFIVDSDERLIGALSDGDIRRWLIKTGDLKASVVQAMNNTPKYVLEKYEEDATRLLDENFITAIPVVDNQMHIVGVVDNKNKSKKVYRASNKLKGVPVVMMAGGKGTRLYPYTKILPKPLIPVGNKPIAELIIDSFCEYGCNEYYLIVNHKKNMIKAYFGELETDYNVHFVDEDVPLGTGGGVSLLKGMIKDTFILTNCDNIVEEDYYKIYEYHKEHKNLITMICSLKNFNIPYGVVNLANEGAIKAMEEKPTFSFFTNTGCYIVEPEVIDDIPEGTFMGFPDMIEKYRSEGKNVGVYPISENAWLDMGEMDALEKMRAHLENKE